MQRDQEDNEVNVETENAILKRAERTVYHENKKKETVNTEM